MRHKYKTYLRFFVRLRRFLDTPITFDQARSVLVQALAQREENFLQMLRDCVYANPASPYLPLLNKAGFTYDDIAVGVHADGVDTYLSRLKAAGVWVSFGAFKSAHQDFNNYAIASAFEVSSGGSSGRAARSHLDLDYLALRACYDHVLFRMLDLYDVPLALWYPKLPAVTGVSNSMRYTKIGQTPDRWFSLLPTETIKSGRVFSLATELILWASRLSRHPLPRPVLLEMNDVNGALDWILTSRQPTGRCAFQSYVSQAVHIAQTARLRGMDLTGVLFIVGSEPLTERKQQEIRATGARVYARYFASEIGSIGVECGAPSCAGDYHLATPSIAAVPDGEALLFTALYRCAPKVLINVQLGDSGVMEERNCGCLLGELGLRTHVRQVSSFQRVTSEGMAVGFRELGRVIEEALVPKYGGSLRDYQWIEREDVRSRTRLCLRVSPDRGNINEPELVETVLTWLQRGDAGLRLAAGVWRRAGTIQVVRERPHLTVVGKTVAVMRDTRQP